MPTTRRRPLLITTSVAAVLLLVFAALLLGGVFDGPRDTVVRTHPWASFARGAWVDVHTNHVMSSGPGAAPSAWDSDSRMIVAEIGADSVLIRHDNPAISLSESTSVVVPALDEFPGVRAVGQWPHDIFPMGRERHAGVTREDKQPQPRISARRHCAANRSRSPVHHSMLR